MPRLNLRRNVESWRDRPVCWRGGGAPIILACGLSLGQRFLKYGITKIAQLPESRYRHAAILVHLGCKEIEHWLGQFQRVSADTGG